MAIKKIALLSVGMLVVFFSISRATDAEDGVKAGYSPEEKAAFAEKWQDATRRLISAVDGRTMRVGDNQYSIVKAILEEGPFVPGFLVNRYHPDPKEDGKTALMALRSEVTGDYAEHVPLSDVDYDSDDLFTPEGGVLEILDLLLAAGANVKAKDTNGQTALMHAVRHEENHVVKRLSQEKVALNLTNCWGQTALIVAAQEENLIALKILLKAGAYVYTVDHDGRTALDHAESLCDIAREEAQWARDHKDFHYKGYYEQSDERRRKRDLKEMVELLYAAEEKGRSKAHRGYTEGQGRGGRGRGGSRGRGGYRGRGRGHRGGGGVGKA